VPATQSEVPQSSPQQSEPNGGELSTDPKEDNAQQLTAEEPTYPFSALFAAWSLAAEPLYSEEEVVALAERRGLQAEKLSGVKWDVLRAIDRPAVVWLRDENADLKSYLLESIVENRLSLKGTSGRQTLDLEVFLEQWSGVFLYLWRPPVEFNRLRLGDINPQGLSWLQAKLQQVDSNYEQIITGGRYNAAVREQVVGFQTQQGIKADGVVGRQTLMRINQLTDSSIPTISVRDDLSDNSSQSWRYDDSDGWVRR
jgi:general secretion pathway protein A